MFKKTAVYIHSRI